MNDDGVKEFVVPEAKCFDCNTMGQKSISSVYEEYQSNCHVELRLYVRSEIIVC
jgi:hypothetical protein